MDAELSELYQEVILDHSRSPRNFKPLPEANRVAQGRNPICGDNYTVFLKLKDDVIQEVAFQGSGCAISKASASVMTGEVKGKTREQAQKMFSQFQEVVMTGNLSLEAGKLAAFAGVHKFPARVKCAILSWHALKAALEGTKEVSTENEK